MKKINIIIFSFIFILSLSTNNYFLTFGEDILYFSLPWMSSNISNSFPCWDYNTLLGAPNISSIELLFFSPLTLLLRFNILSVENFFSFIMSLYLVAAAGLMFYWIYKKTGNIYSAITAAVIFTFGGFTANCVFKGHYMLIGSYCLYPLIFFLAEKKINDEHSIFKLSAYDFLFILIFALQILAGHPQQVYYQCLILFPYIFLANKNNLKLKIKIALKIGILCFIAALLCAAQLLPTYFFSKETVRPISAGINIAHQYSTSLNHLVQTIFPFFWGNSITDNFYLSSFEDYSQYIGFTTTILLFISLFQIINFTTKARRQKKEKTNSFFHLVSSWLKSSFQSNNQIEQLFWLGIIIISLVLAFGQYFPLYELFYNYIPGFKMFRAPIRLFSITLFAASILSAFTIDSLIINRKLNKQNNRLIFLLSILNILIIVFFVFCPDIINLITKIKNNSSFIKNINSAILENNFNSIVKAIRYQLLIGFLFVSAILIFLKSRFQKILIAIIILILTAELLIFFINILPKIIDTTSLKPNRHSEVYKYILADTDIFRIKYYENQQNINKNLYIPNLRNIDGYQSFISNNIAMLQCYINERDDIDRIVKSNRIFFENIDSYKFNLTGVKYLISSSPLNLQNWEYIISDKNEYLYKNKNILPMFFPVKQISFQTSDSYDFTELDKITNYLDNALVYSANNIQTEYNPETFKIKELKYSNDKIHLKTYSENPQYIVSLEPFDKDWKLYINGKEEKFYRTNLFFRGFQISAGENEIVFEYKPIQFKIGLIISILSGLILLYFIVIWFIWSIRVNTKHRLTK